jgi:hypothetical protein
MILLSGMPMPPSVNAAYYTDRQTGTRHKTRDYLLFSREFQVWGLRNMQSLIAARNFVQATIRPGQALHVEHIFSFERSKIVQAKDSKSVKDPLNFRRAGEPKTNDTSNRIKILDDVLSDALHVNDCWFWSGSYTKRILLPGLPETCDVVLTATKMEDFAP